ncbi:accessory gene regulator B [Paenibacillus phyllosphaerae]|uniref:Accessory gene regulator B n=1 Tax=Paenibacillus phyllosphaerae TaxID=274593 RepID=A0A7W5B3M0_9BACL|nr:accessory gene regulator B family protein [Paenibacillus phyllosphaerae]MBB3113612.1 accessory gene regulator B [Paenibacillus phyllosphaerae]
MIDTLSLKIAVGIKAKVPEHPASVNVLKFAIAALINGLTIILFSLIGSLVTDTFIEAITVLVSFAILRQLSGGYHLKSGVACIVVSTVGVLALSLTGDLGAEFVFILNVINVILAIVFSPSDIEKQSRIKKKYFPFLKLSSTMLVAINFAIGSPVLASTFLVQCLTLIKLPIRERKGVVK